MKKFFLIALCIVLLCVLIVLTAGFGAYRYFSSDLPRMASLRDYRPALVTQVFANKGELIGEFFIVRSYPV